MKIQKDINTYCPYCNKHTPHVVKTVLSAKPVNPSRGLSVNIRRFERKHRGYIGKVKGKTPKKKLSQRQKIILECNTCHKKIERVMGNRTKKKLEIKR
ncbi:MAG: 50S ribosomal protein L44e [Candidatus Micrarchaeota archaeon]|nr:50S ribosomal protein L44e [Candidatus Micrarchaeota archaeon]MDE1804341.1 50S ribosomal protein L44e [Candidatus Micrarchaeota archaeon]MDE1846554.1 50S ribosomal protein L44e [Candidatus Micrarchaeota archaeon]